MSGISRADESPATEAVLAYVECRAEEDPDQPSQCFADDLVQVLRARTEHEAEVLKTQFEDAFAESGDWMGPYNLSGMPSPTQLTCPMDFLDIAYGETVEIPTLDGVSWTLGERGSQLAVNNCRLMLQWMPEAIAEVMPDDWMSDTAKVTFFTAVVAPIRRLCDCLEADAAMADDAMFEDIQTRIEESFEMLDANFPADGGERASQESLDASREAIVATDNANRDLVLANATANRDAIVANATANRDATRVLAKTVAAMIANYSVNHTSDHFNYSGESLNKVPLRLRVPAPLVDAPSGAAMLVHGLLDAGVSGVAENLGFQCR